MKVSKTFILKVFGTFFVVINAFSAKEAIERVNVSMYDAELLKFSIENGMIFESDSIMEQSYIRKRGK